MKRLITLLLALLVAAQAFAFPLQHRRKLTTTTISGIAAVAVATGKITANGCDGATLACECGAMTASVVPGACCAGAAGDCTGATALVDDGGTGVYNITLNAGDVNDEKCIVTVVCGAGYVDQVIEIDTAEYLSYENITSMTATQPAVVHAGNTTGQGELIQGGVGGDGQVIAGNATAAPAGTGSGLVALAGSNGQGGWFQGAGTGSGIFSTGRAGMQLLAPSGAPVTTVAGGLWSRGTSGYYGAGIESTGANGIALNINNNAGGTAATGGLAALKITGAAGAVGGPALGLYAGSNTGGAGGDALVLVGGESTWNNAGGKGGSAINAASGASHASATAWNPTIIATNDKADILQLTATGGNSDAIQLTPAGTGVGINGFTVSGSGAWTVAEQNQIRKALGITGTTATTSGDGNLDRLLLRRD